MYSGNENTLLSERANEEFKQNSLLQLLNRNRFLSNQEVSRGYLFDEKILSSHIISSNFKNVSILNSTFMNCNFNDVTFELSELKSLFFMNCSFTTVRFINNMVENINFENCFFDRCEIDFKVTGIKTSNVYFYIPKELNTQNKDSKEAIVTKPHAQKQSIVTPLLKEPSLEPLGRFGHLDLEEK